MGVEVFPEGLQGGGVRHDRLEQFHVGLILPLSQRERRQVREKSA
jgi:hypothetical protein